jgi:hypothetical protein
MGSGLAPTVFQTNGASDAATDVTWSQQHSTRFASVTGDGRVMVWDTASLTPLINHHVQVCAAPMLCSVVGERIAWIAPLLLFC